MEAGDTSRTLATKKLRGPGKLRSLYFFSAMSATLKTKRRGLRGRIYLKAGGGILHRRSGRPKKSGVRRSSHGSLSLSSGCISKKERDRTGVPRVVEDTQTIVRIKKGRDRKRGGDYPVIY